MIIDNVKIPPPPPLSKGEGIVAVFLFFAIIFSYNETALADTGNDEGQKIRLEKAQIIGAVERPGTFYNIPWSSPEVQEKVHFEFSRDFKKEVFEFIDRDEIIRRHHGVDR
ncbi:MAG: hypothetical protein HZA19_05395 [Nitrospirae bacterium]|nr:hypothetical protein [Nitrospirota bacterium]